MNTQTDLITGERTYTLTVDSLTISLFGRAKGEVRLTCTPEGQLTAFEAVAHPAPFLVRQKAETIAEAATWDLPASELNAVPDNSRIIVRLTLGDKALAGLQTTSVFAAEDVVALIERAQDEPPGAWQVEDIEVEI